MRRGCWGWEGRLLGMGGEMCEGRLLGMGGEMCEGRLLGMGGDMVEGWVRRGCVPLSLSF